MVLMREIDKEIFRTVEFTEFLKQVAIKGNQKSVMNDMNTVTIGRMSVNNQRMLRGDPGEESIV